MNKLWLVYIKRVPMLDHIPKWRDQESFLMYHLQTQMLIHTPTVWLSNIPLRSIRSRRSWRTFTCKFYFKFYIRSVLFILISLLDTRPRQMMALVSTGSLSGVIAHVIELNLPLASSIDSFSSSMYISEPMKILNLEPKPKIYAS